MAQDNKSKQQLEKLDYYSQVLVDLRAKFNYENNQQNKLVIDRTVFTKSLEEKKIANTAKGNYKLLQRNKTKFFETQTALWDSILQYKPKFNVNYVVSKN